MLWSAVVGLSPLVARLAGGAEERAADERSDGEGTDEKLPPLEVTIDEDEVDLEVGRLEVRLSRPAARVTLKVIAQSGAVTAELSRQFDAAPAGVPLEMRWPVDAGDPVARIEVFGHDVHGYYKGVAITPWSFEVPHRDVTFDTDSAEIRPSEEKKLEDSRTRIAALFRRHASLGPVTLYVVAHTDRVGSEAHNLRLSTRRAHAIAGWFRQRGLKLPILYDGLGESVPKVPTDDEVAEAKNRRVDYSLALRPPRFKKSGGSPAWKKI